MLVLSRKKGESIIIQDHIEVTILDVDAETIKIGISAPEDVEILRKELITSVKDSNVQSALKQGDINQLAANLNKMKKNKI